MLICLVYNHTNILPLYDTDLKCLTLKLYIMPKHSSAFDRVMRSSEFLADPNGLNIICTKYCRRARIHTLQRFSIWMSSPTMISYMPKTQLFYVIFQELIWKNCHVQGSLLWFYTDSTKVLAYWKKKRRGSIWYLDFFIDAALRINQKLANL